jgi:signal transduction histidine kinase
MSKIFRRIPRPDLGILPKLLICFLSISMVPLVVLTYFANRNLQRTGLMALRSAEEMGEKNLTAAENTGRHAITDSVHALDAKSTEAIELRTVELAQRIADFLYERDLDILALSKFKPEPQKYLEIYKALKRDVIVPGPWPPGAPATTKRIADLPCDNPENKTGWRHRPPYDFKKVSRPLYREITFVDLTGRESIKVKDGKISDDLRDVSQKANTYCRAEDYFVHLGRLRRGEIYVSRVIGAYVKGWLYKDSEGTKVRPDSAYAGKENPHGKKFEGIIRWATPIFDEKGQKLGYVTMALDHTHVIELTNHIVPTEERFSDRPDAGSGNYAFLWDDQDRCIAHPRQFFICGYDPKTGREVPGWVSQETYDEYKKSGMDLPAFIASLPSFRNFTFKKPGAKEQIKEGNISLDCRILDMAPQCEGWHSGTEDGGSGSFLIFWSGLWKLTTYATVPYYTGMYGKSKRGFGYVTIGANADDFHQAANETKAYIEKNTRGQEANIETATDDARLAIEESLTQNRKLMMSITLVSAALIIAASILISLTITRPLRRLTAGAAAIGRGELHQHIEVRSRGEIGQLAETFNDMATAVAEVDRMKSEFVTIASHELRTPIHAMMLGVSGMLDGYSGEINEEVREDLVVVQDGIDRLRRLVDNLLDLSRIEARKIELSIVKVSPTDIIEAAVEDVADLAKAHGHVLAKTVSEALPNFDGDKDRLVQVIVNLLSNSIKYTPDGGKILVGAERRDHEVVFTVVDNGYGIPSWAGEKIFEKFFQADHVMSQKVGGSGLGLTISRGIVEEHGGSIRFDSPVPTGAFTDLPFDGTRKGTIFFVYLPLSSPEQRR